MNKLRDDLSNLTTIPKQSLDRLADLSELCICSTVGESIALGENVSSINIGIGTLSILACDDCVKYKFSPSKTLEDRIVNMIKTGKNPLVDEIETKIIDRIVNTYKDLL